MLDTPEAWIEHLGLQPLPIEGGYFRETLRADATEATDTGTRSRYTAIYYLLEPGSVSLMHRLACDEIYTFVAGDPVVMLQLGAPPLDGREIRLGNRGDAGVEPLVLVPRATWQGSRLEVGGRYALLTAVCVPGYDQADFELGGRRELAAAYPAFRGPIGDLTRPD